MPSGPKMSEKVKMAIAMEALKDLQEPRRVVAARLRRLIAEQLREPVPQEDTLLKLISHVRNLAPDTTDAPWSMALLGDPDCEIPPTTVTTVLQVWRYAVATHESFTIRQATWASRLHGLFPEPVLTWWWSLNYASAERACDALEVPVETSGLDALMAMLPFEREASWHTDFVPALAGLQFLTRPFPLASDGSPLYELIHWPEYAADPHAACINMDGFDTKRVAQVYRLIRGLPPLAQLGLTEEWTNVYLRWLTHLYTGPKWQSLTPEEMRDIVVQLRHLVADAMVKVSGLTPSFQPADTTMWFTVYPSDLLDRVGLPRNYAKDYLDYHHEHGEWPPQPLEPGDAD